jgi:hypothetical protein
MQIKLRALQLEEDRLEFDKQRHEDIMRLEYARLGIKPTEKQPETRETTIEELLGAILSGRNSF